MKPSWIATTTKVVIPSPYDGDDGEFSFVVAYDEEGRLDEIGFTFSRDRIDARYIKGIAEFLATIKDHPICPRPAWETKEEAKSPILATAEALVKAQSL